MSNRSKLVRMRIRNFGCIGPDGLTIELDNIVCLVGTNNSGKSTVLRAYEAAVNRLALRPQDIFATPDGQPASVELWVHIPEGTANVDEKWKERTEDGLLLVRSKWEWMAAGGAPVRSTWDPEHNDYAEDNKASGLDTVFNSRLPKPFRIGALEAPAEEHKKLLKLVLDPVIDDINRLMADEHSPLRTQLNELRKAALQPVNVFRERLDEVQEKVNRAYQRVFTNAEIKFLVSLDELTIDLGAALLKGSHVGLVENNGQVRWEQQGTGSQRALFWSMLEVRSGLNRIADERKAKEKERQEKTKKIKELQKKRDDAKKATTRAEYDEKIKQLEDELASNTPRCASEPFLPGYMLLIDEPETALHPSAVRAAKEHLYSLASESGWQVMLSTHHPVFLDPLKDHTTIIRLARRRDGQTKIYRTDKITFSAEEKENLKSLLAFDSSVAEMFFANRVIVVEGDTEFAAFNEIMRQEEDTFPLESRPLILRARGKATIPTLVRMLSHFKVDFAVLHDIDAPRTKGGEKTNPAYTVNQQIVGAIEEARDRGVSVIHRVSCPNFEVHHGMKLPEKDKPFASWKAVRDLHSVKDSVRRLLNSLCDQPTKDAKTDPDDGARYEELLKNWVNSQGVKDAAYQFR